MKLSSPFSIGSRLLPSLAIGDGAISLEYIGESSGRMTFRWYIDIPAGQFSAADLKSGMQGCSTQEMFGTLLSFLGAAAESYAYGMRTGNPGENADLFPAPVVEWAYQHSDEIGMVQSEIEDSGAELIVD